MGKEEAILSMLSEIRDLLRGSHPEEKRVVDILSGEKRDLEELKYADDRAIDLHDGNFLDIYLSLYFKRPHFWEGPGSEKHINRGEAEKYVAESGGDLPEIFALTSLYDYAKGCLVPAAVKMGFKTDDWYWAKEHSGDPVCARMVNLKHGSVFYDGKASSNYVRCVRLSQ